MPETNSLGLDFDQHTTPAEPPVEHTTDEQPAEQPTETDSKTETTSQSHDAEPKEKKKPYVNPERVKTGGQQRDKLSEEALSERIARMKEQNEKIKQRRLDVKADEDAFKKTQESDRVKLAQTRKVQEHVDRTREQNAQRKMAKLQSREWDSGKSTSDWKHPPRKPAQDAATSSDSVPAPKDGAVDLWSALSNDHGSNGSNGTNGRGGPRGGAPRGRGRGRGRGAAPAGSYEGRKEKSPEKSPAPEWPAEPAAKPIAEVVESPPTEESTPAATEESWGAEESSWGTYEASW